MKIFFLLFVLNLAATAFSFDANLFLCILM